MNRSLALSLLVVRCADLERSRAFYSELGIVFVREQHGGGPVHYSGMIGETVFELYPKGSKNTSDLRFGIRVEAGPNLLDALVASGGEVVSRPSAEKSAVVRDPDQHTIEISFV